MGDILNESKVTYLETLALAMSYLAEQEKVVFIGQSIKWHGHALFNSMNAVPDEKKIEMPVFEDFQFGMSIGMALEGLIPVSVFPRMDFLITAANQLTNHLANIEEFGEGKWKPRVIVRVSVGGTHPLDPGPQHYQDHTGALTLLARGKVNIITLRNKKQILPEYKKALIRNDITSSILIEYSELYNS